MVISKGPFARNLFFGLRLDQGQLVLGSVAHPHLEGPKGGVNGTLGLRQLHKIWRQVAGAKELVFADLPPPVPRHLQLLVVPGKDPLNVQHA